MTVEWTHSSTPIDYRDAEERMRQRRLNLRAGLAREWVWLLEHPSVYTLGASDRDHPSLATTIPVLQTDRGGHITYHGPGQRVVYVVLDLRARQLDVRTFMSLFEQWLQAALLKLGVATLTDPERRGLWCPPSATSSMSRPSKIAAVGLSIKQGVTQYGAAININPDMSFFAKITPCNLEGYGVTSLHAHNPEINANDLDQSLRGEFKSFF